MPANKTYYVWLEEKKKYEGQKIGVIERKLLFLYDIWYMGRKENEDLVKLQFINYKNVILF